MLLYDDFEEVFKGIAELNCDGVRELLFVDVPWGWGRNEQGYRSGISCFCSRKTKRVIKATALGNFHHKEKERLDDWIKSFEIKMDSVESKHLSAIEKELRALLCECEIPRCFSEEDNQCSDTSCVFSHFTETEKNLEIIGDPPCYFQQRKLVLDIEDQLTFLYYALMFSIRWQNTRNRMESDYLDFNNAVAHNKVEFSATRAEDFGAKESVGDAKFFALCGILEGVENIETDEFYMQRKSIARIGRKFRFLAPGAASGWIEDGEVRCALEDRLKSLDESNFPDGCVQFLLIHPQAECFDRVKKSFGPPHPRLYRTWKQLDESYRCLEVRLYHKRTFRLQIEDRFALISKCEGEKMEVKPATVISHYGKEAEWIQASLYDGLNDLFDLIWTMETSCCILDFFKQENSESVLGGIEKDYHCETKPSMLEVIRDG